MERSQHKEGRKRGLPGVAVEGSLRIFTEEQSEQMSVHKKILLPFTFDCPGKLPDEGDVVRAEWAEPQIHAGFFRGTIAFFVVALDAGTDEIFPCITPAA